MKVPLDRERLAKLLGLLGSEHDGEVVTAARRADALVQGTRLTWREVLISALTRITAVSFGVIERHRVLPTAVASSREQRFPPTTRQRKKLNAIVDKLRRRAEAA